MLLQISKCDRRLLSIKIPNNITRSPQSIHQLVKWKGEKEDNVKDCIHVCLYLTAGSELQNWLLYYSVPVLKDILPEKYFQHYLLLVIGFHLLLGEEVSQHQLEMADVCFKNFYVEFSELYGKKTNKCTIS